MIDRRRGPDWIAHAVLCTGIFILAFFRTLWQARSVNRIAAAEDV